MTPEELKQQFQERHQQAVNEFGPAERLIDTNAVKTWHTKTVVDHVSDFDGISYDYENPIPVYSGDKQVGSALLTIEGYAVKAELFTEYGVPERLDVENGNSVYIKLHAYAEKEYVRVRDGVESLPGARFVVTSLEFTKEPQLRGLPISSVL
jgi:hypothetical protein